MKIPTPKLTVLSVWLLAVRAAATTYYVDINNANPVPPYTSWSTASTDIQSAVNETTNGDLVLVNPGVYQSGGYTAPDGSLTAVVVTNAVTLQSVNGAGATSVNGGNIMRGVYLGDGAELFGFTIANGTTTAHPLIDADNGGGIYCQSTNATVFDCIIASNSCLYAGAGIYSGTAIGCQIIDNTNRSSGSYGGGGGAAYSVLLNDAVSSNSIGDDGPGSAGAFSCILSNCVIDGNTMGGVLYSTLNSCTVENNTHTIYAGGAALSTLNNCLVCNNQGGMVTGGGAYDCTLNYCVISNNFSSSSGGGVYYDSKQTNALGQQNIVVGNNAPGDGGGVYLGINTNLDNWTFISNSAAGSGGAVYVAMQGTILNNCTFVGNSSGANGGGVCGLNQYPESVSNCTFVANAASGNGGGAYSAALTNCYVIGNKAANGGGVYGIANNCVLNENSATTNGGGLYYYFSGFLPYPAVLDCAFTNNFAVNGGGAFAGVLSPDFTNCIFWANRATNSGGGIYGPGTISYCIVSDNTAEDGGGAYNVSLVNCLLNGNSAAYGGGAYYGTPLLIAQGSTIAGNNATNAGGGFYWTVVPGGLTNCVIYDNSAPSDMNYPPANFYGAFYCCTTPLPLARAGGGNNNNITNDPSFMNAAGGDFHLSFNSPCINSGNNATVAGSVDLDGNPRIVGGTVDIGAYEYQTPVSKISYAWLDQYGLPIVAGIDTSDLDGTGFTVYQDWIAGLNPTNPASVLAMQTPVATNNASGIKVTWQSVSGVLYFLQRSTNLTSQPPFSTIQYNITGQSNTTSYTDTSATNNVPYFYRVGVIAP